MSAETIITEVDITIMLDEAHSIRVKDLPLSIVIAHNALQHSKAISHNALIAKSLTRLSLYNMISGAFETSIKQAQEATKIYEELDDELGIADAKYTIASVYYKSDNLHLGLRYVTECLAIYEKYNDYASQAKAYKTLGTIYEFFGDIDNAIHSYKASVRAAEQVNDLNMISNAYNPLSGLLLNQDNIEEALTIIEKSIELKQLTGDKRGMAFSYYGRGKIYTQTNQFEKAEADFEASLQIHIEAGEKLGQFMTLQKQGVLYKKIGALDKAKAKFLEALALSETYNMQIIKTRSSRLLYEVYKEEGDLTNALFYFEKYLNYIETSERNQSQQIITSYNLIHAMEAKALEDKMQLERAEIIEKKNKAEFLAKTKQEFLSNMSHEIRTPLNAVITITNLLKERADIEDQKLLESLQFASTNLLLLINDILDFTKIDLGKVKLENRPTPIRSLLNNIKNTYSSLAKEKGLNLILEVGEQLNVAYELDETKLSQILNNLIGNAIKFTNRGSVKLCVDKVAENTTQHEIGFKIIDTGVGIPSDFLGELFESFTQPLSVTTKKQGGSGLGLAIVKKLIQLHGSDIHIDTKEGKGSTFYFNLWLQPCESQNEKVVQKNQSLTGLEVLLAEDNAINTLVATKLLSKWGIVADCAKNGVEAVEKTNHKKYDVILMDIHMPEMNGYDATVAIRTSKNSNAQTPIFAFTADIMVNDPSYDQYFNGFLRKPIEIEQLYQAISTLK
jgi:signal transduction histidine kinase/CheY-like chemotaxis protein